MHNNIQKKLILYIVPIVFIVITISYGISMSNSKKIVEQEIYQTIDAKRDEQSKAIEDAILKVKDTADIYARGIGRIYQNFNADIYNSILETMLLQDTRLSSGGIWLEPSVLNETQLDERYFIQNIDGTLVHYTNSNFETKSSYVALNYLNSPSYIRAKELNKSFFSDAYYHGLLDTYTITYVSPIQNSNGEFIGCVSASFDINQLKNLVDKYSNESLNFYILDASGTYIAHTDLELVQSQANIQDYSTDFKENAQTILSSEAGTLTHIENGKEYYIYYDTVTSFNWKLVYEVPAKTVKQPLLKLTLFNVTICVISIFVLIFLILYVSNKFVNKPLQLLLGEFKNISNNNYDSDIPKQLLTNKTEFSDIGNALAEMKSNLTQYQDSLTYKNELLIAKEQTLNETVEYTNAIISALPIMMFVFDKEGYCLELYGPTPFSKKPHEYFKGRHCLELLTEYDENTVGVHEFFEILKTIDYNDGVVHAEISLKINGNQEYFEHSLTLCRDNLIICLTRRATDTVNHIQNMEYITEFDELTGLYNTRYFFDWLSKPVKNSNLPISIIVCDVNGLNGINNNLGFDTGNQLLVDLATTFNNINVENKMVSRVAGDEFAIVLPNTTTIEAENIIENINSKCLLGKVSKIPFSIAYGIDALTSEKDSLLQTIESVEKLLYKQKVYTSSGKKDNSIGLINSIFHAKNKREQLHSNRVSELCLEMAKALGWSALEQNKISTAGILHDIGKIGISESILNKPGKLTDAEYTEMCTHPEVGYRILKSFENMKELADYAYAHHEKWDGTGYPRKLKGTEIPIEARILAIADTYDAMTSSRSYREGLPKEVAIAELIRCKGTQFDPELVDIFIEKVLLENLLDYQV